MTALVFSIGCQDDAPRGPAESSGTQTTRIMRFDAQIEKAQREVRWSFQEGEIFQTWLWGSARRAVGNAFRWRLPWASLQSAIHLPHRFSMDTFWTARLISPLF